MVVKWGQTMIEILERRMLCVEHIDDYCYYYYYYYYKYYYLYLYHHPLNCCCCYY
jgi:hypothetical protein